MRSALADEVVQLIGEHRGHRSLESCGDGPQLPLQPSGRARRQLRLVQFIVGGVEQRPHPQYPVGRFHPAGGGRPAVPVQHDSQAGAASSWPTGCGVVSAGAVLSIPASRFPVANALLHRLAT